MFMLVSLPLDRMTVAEKLDLIEVIWEDLDKRSAEIESPAWHGEVLNEVDRRLASGEEELRDWAEVKAALIAERK